MRQRHSTNPWVILVLICLAQFMVILDIAVVNIALPSMRTGLHFSATGLQWVVNAYTLTFAGFLLLGGRAADLFGRRRIFLLGLTVFTASSLLGGLAQNEAWLVSARALQGLGAAILAPATLT
ncbi:MAG: MFS transporter, partial [Acidobacteriota bacterium]|nr:MFS transporter [Acidobacteriota bacterium]